MSKLNKNFDIPQTLEQFPRNPTPFPQKGLPPCSTLQDPLWKYLSNFAYCILRINYTASEFSPCQDFVRYTPGSTWHVRFCKAQICLLQKVFTHKKESILQPFQNFHLRIPGGSNLRPIQTGQNLEVLPRIAFIGHCKFFPCHLLITHHQYLQCWQGGLHLPLQKVNSIWKLTNPADRPSKFKPAAASHFFQEDLVEKKTCLWSIHIQASKFNWIL